MAESGDGVADANAAVPPVGDLSGTGEPAPAPASDSEPAPAVTTKTASRRRRWLIRGLKWFAVLVVVWLLAAYVILPAVWKHYEHLPALETAPKTTVTGSGIPGDPLNVGLIGHEHEVVHALLESGWDPADPVTLRTSLRIARSVVMDRPYADAPVSNLFLFDRKQDLAFEKSVGDNARRRHHVRFWRSSELGRGGTPLWLGAVTFDQSVGLSHRTGQITHHIGPDVDAERNGLMGDLRRHGWLTELFQVTGVGSTLIGRNGGGDPYYTDGELTIGVLASEKTRNESPRRLENPPAVQIKEQFWSAIRPLLQSLQGP